MPLLPGHSEIASSSVMETLAFPKPGVLAVASIQEEQETPAAIRFTSIPALSLYQFRRERSRPGVSGRRSRGSTHDYRREVLADCVSLGDG